MRGLSFPNSIGFENHYLMLLLALEGGRSKMARDIYAEYHKWDLVRDDRTYSFIT